MIAALRGSTALFVIGVFHALLAGNGRLIDASTPVAVDCFRVVAVFVLDAPAAVTWAPDTDEDADADDVVTDEAVSDAVPRPTEGAACTAGVAALTLLFAPCVQPPTSITVAIRAAGSTYSRGRRTPAG